MTSQDLPHLVDRWAEGFARSRQVGYARYGDVIEVDVEGGGRRLELVLVEPDRDLLGTTAARVAGTHDVWLTAFSAGPWGHDTPEGLRTVLDGEVLMTRSLESQPPGAVELEVHGQRLYGVVRDGDVVAAGGWVAAVGEHAVFDRVETHPDYRRRGLASQVMRALETWAVEQGAPRGILAASVEGQALYAHLGWQVAARMTTLGGAPAPG